MQIVWQGIWILFAISVFVSKSGITFFGSALVLWSIFKIDWKATLKQNPWFFLILSFFPLALLQSFLSLGKSEAALNVVQSWPWPLYVLPFWILFKEQKTLKVFSWALVVGLFIACGKALFIFGNEFNWQFSSGVRVASFWDVGRWAQLLAVTCVAMFALWGSSELQKAASRLTKSIIPISMFTALAFLVLANSRGPWLGAAFGLGLLGLSSKAYFKRLLLLAGLAVGAAMLIPGIGTRLQSSFSAKAENGVVTSADASNAGRLHMWQVNFDFYKEQPIFGTGFEMAEKPLRAFLEKKGPEYSQKYVMSEFSFRDQHNSYLWLLVQMGALFFIYFWGVIALILFKSIRGFFGLGDTWSKMAFAALATHLFTFIFYSSVSSYEMLWFFPFLLVLTIRNRGDSLTKPVI